MGTSLLSSRQGGLYRSLPLTRLQSAKSQVFLIGLSVGLQSVFNQFGEFFDPAPVLPLRRPDGPRVPLPSAGRPAAQMDAMSVETRPHLICFVSVQSLRKNLV
jgi:hypothetical protein